MAPISVSLEDNRETSDFFGHALAKGDFNGDGYDDLAVDAHGEDVDGVANAGAVQVIYGTYYGLSNSWDTLLTQNDVTGTGIEANDHFGYALTAGDFNGDGYDDLAIGVPREDSGATNSGAVQVLEGWDSPAGLRAVSAAWWYYQGKKGSLFPTGPDPVSPTIIL